MDKNCWSARGARSSSHLWHHKSIFRLFGVRSLDQLPPLDEIRELVEPVLDPDAPAAAQPSGNGGAEEPQDEAAAEQQDEPVGEQNEGVSEQPAAAELSAAENADTETTPEANSADPSADQGDDPETPQQAQ